MTIATRRPRNAVMSSENPMLVGKVYPPNKLLIETVEKERGIPGMQ